MTATAKLCCGIILLTVPTIQYGGYFLLTILSGTANLPLTDFQKGMFRAGHAHAGVLVLLALIAQLLADQAHFGTALDCTVRTGFIAAAILVSAGFFAAAIEKGSVRPNALIAILYLGVAVLAGATLTLGVGLIRVGMR